jgi:Holliday junction DNA helicase RuvA
MGGEPASRRVRHAGRAEFEVELTGTVLMITSIQGILTSATPLHAIVELNGFGYEVNIPVTTAEKLPVAGSSVKLHTLVIYREDAQTLYGFATTNERDFFRLMIENVTGVGPKMALSIMSRLSLPLLQSAIRMGDVATLAKCPGIGKKTAERLVVELRAKVGATDATSVIGATGAEETSGDSTHRDAVSALIALGYKAADADQAVRRAAIGIGGSATTEALIKRALNG